MSVQLEWSFNLLQILALGAVKLSLIYLYRRVFLGRSFELLSTIMIVIVVAWTITFFFATVFLCRTDFWAIWGSLADLLSHCVNTSKVTVYFSATDVATDILILIMPLRSVGYPQLVRERPAHISLCRFGSCK